MSRKTYQLIQLALLLLTTGTMGAVLYFQWILGLQPCPLCWMQRFCVFFLFIFCLIGVRRGFGSSYRRFLFLQIGFAIAGLFFASRQLWLQSLPANEVPACLPGLDILIHYFPWRDVWQALFWGTADCAEVTWTGLGFSMPFWSLLYFFIILMANGLILFLIGRTRVTSP